MGAIEIHGVGEIINRLEVLSNKFDEQKMQKTLLTVGNIIRNSIEDSFERETSPFGGKWEPNSRGGKILSDSGRLNSSFTIKATSNSVTVGTNIKYAAIHNFGGIIKPKNKNYLRFRVGGKWVTTKSVKIPKRQFMPISGGGELLPKTKNEIMSYLNRL